jgi:mono/diheme cytochrome c family protein
MPAYAWKLGDDEIAAVASYVRNAWGNKAPAVTADTVKDMRKAIGGNKATTQTVGAGSEVREKAH